MSQTPDAAPEVTTEAATAAAAEQTPVAEASAEAVAPEAVPAEAAPAESAPAESATAAAAAAEAAPAPELDPVSAAIAPGYEFEGPALELGGLMLDPDTLTGVPIRIPLAMVNRHGLVAGATGTGKTKTLQLMAEQLSAAGVPVFAADIKGDLSGLSVPGEGGEKISSRAATVGQTWTATGFPTEFYALGGEGIGIPLRVTMSAFGPTLLSKVLDLNDTQESSLGLVFHYADTQGLPLLDLSDLRAVLTYLLSDEGKAELKTIGGLSTATAGVILRELVNFEAQGADKFFGEPEFASSDLLQTTADGRGLVSLLELPNLQDRPALFSTFLMWLLADLFHDLPEVGDIDRPKLVFFFDEAHLLFKGASKPFLEQIAQTVRLIRSKGVGVFFVTQSPTDVPDDVLAQLGSRVQHQLRAHTPNDAKALKATVNTYPHSEYDDLGKVITSLGIGEAVVTVMNERGAPTPVAWTRLRAPESLMGPAEASAMEASVKASPRYATYAEAVDRDSARERLAAKLEEGARKAREEAELKEQARQDKLDKAAADKAAKAEASRKVPVPKTSGRAPRQEDSMLEKVVESGAFKDFMRTAAREIARGMFKSGRR
ncbi:MAG: helicase HerA-like domain-containing protein [Nocardioides sp.]|uniref:helicase HerA-like domain-containing protein n=1 Tax=Nocardioides sp. TaxID=35761 RepID=UPI003EFD343F